jgi:hypothetical protein
MTTKVTSPSHSAAVGPKKSPLAAPWPTPPWNTEERLQRIQAMGQQINGYIQFLSPIGDLKGTSTEAKDIAVTAFYERMVIVQRQLGRIHEDLQLG